MDTDRALKILQLSPNASLDDIKKSYRQMAKAWHPDKCFDEKQKKEYEDRIKEINQAYNLLRSMSDRVSDHCTSVSDVSDTESIIFKSTPNGCEFFYKRAQQRERSGQDSEALEDCNQAIRINPNYLEAYQLRRFICLKLGYENRAASDNGHIFRLQREAWKPPESKQSENPSSSVKNDPIDSDARSSSASSEGKPEFVDRQKTDDQKEAIDDSNNNQEQTEKVFSQSREEARKYYQRAQRKFKLGREQKAIEDCTTAIKFRPDYLEAYRLRRMIYLNIGKGVEAALDDQEIRKLEKSNESPPKKKVVSGSPSDDPSFFYERAMENFRKGQNQEAILDCNRAIRLNSDYLDAYRLHRMICLQLGYKDRVAFDAKQISRIELKISQSSNPDPDHQG